MGKMNAKGRSKTEPFIRLHRGVTGSPNWKSLSCEARALLIEIWSRHNGQNNGRIPYSHREARQGLHIGSSRASKAFKELERSGFLVARSQSSFNFKAGAGKGLATEWEITTEAANGQPPKSNYKRAKIQNTVPEAKPNGTSAKTVHAELHSKASPSAPETRPLSAKLTGERSHLGCTSNIPGHTSDCGVFETAPCRVGLGSNGPPIQRLNNRKHRKSLY